jgi:hypothetical protein
MRLERRAASHNAMRFAHGVFLLAPSKRQPNHLYTIFTPAAVLFASRLHTIN